MLALSRTDAEFVRLETVGPELPLVTVSRVPEAERARWPAVLVVAGIEPNDRVGPVCAVTAAEALVAAAKTNPATRRSLETASVFFLPQLARIEGGGLEGVRTEITVTSAPPVDDDHDGFVDEDGPEDLNADGMITSMRVQDSAGEFVADPVDARLLATVDRARGESGAWRLLSEGRDNDGDEQWNEDGPGGVNSNRNFPAGYRFFEADAGAHPLSEPATRWLAEFVIAHPNLALAFTFGAADNLTDEPKGEPGGKRPATAVNETDVPWLVELGKGWRKALGFEKTQLGVAWPGTFSDWFYLHRGRLSLAARPWFPAVAPDFTRTSAVPASATAPNAGSALVNPGPASASAVTGATTNAAVVATGADASSGTEPEKRPGKESAANEKPAKDVDKRNETDRAYLRWLDVHAPAAFVPWQRIEHPDFPGRLVEVGGFAPYARSNPPGSLLAEVARREAGFVAELVGRLPQIAIRRSEARSQGNGVFDIRVEVQNTGWLPTVLAHGEVTGEVVPSRVTLALAESGFLSGSRTQRIGPLAGGGGLQEVRWVVLAPGKTNVDVEVVTALAGRAKASISLEEAKR